MQTNRSFGTALLVLTAGLLSACGGGSGGGNRPPVGNQPPAANQPPRISGLQDVTFPQDTSSSVLSFQVLDPDSDPAGLTVTAQAADTSIVPAAGIVLGGSGANRTLQITPAPDIFGATSIVVRAVDPQGASVEFNLRVTVNGVFVSFRDTVNEIFNAAETAEPRRLSGFTFTQDADDDATAFDALLQ